MEIKTGTRFQVRFRCHSCRAIECREIAVPEPPNGEELPSDVDELLGSEFLRRTPFTCAKCDSWIATPVAIKRLGEGMRSAL